MHLEGAPAGAPMLWLSAVRVQPQGWPADGAPALWLSAFADYPQDLEIPTGLLRAYERVPAEAFAIGLEFQNFQTKRGAASASMSPVAASFA